MKEEHKNNGPLGGNNEVEINGTKHVVKSQDISGRKVIELAGNHPVDQQLAFWFSEGNILEDLGFDETVPLKKSKVEKFLTFSNDRSFRFELEGKRQDWGAGCITEPTLRKIGNASDDYLIVLERENEPDKLLQADDIIDLTETGIERFRLEKVLTVKIINEDNGRVVSIRTWRNETVAGVIQKMYIKLGVDRREDDRLRCEENGTDVFQFEALTIGSYLKEHCKCLTWLFAGATGGA